MLNFVFQVNNSKLIRKMLQMLSWSQISGHSSSCAKNHFLTFKMAHKPADPEYVFKKNLITKLMGCKVYYMSKKFPAIHFPIFFYKFLFNNTIAWKFASDFQKSCNFSNKLIF